jgi:hypothetical protein
MTRNEEVKGYVNNVEMHEKKILAATDWANKKNYEYVVNYMR